MEAAQVLYRIETRLAYPGQMGHFFSRSFWLSGQAKKSGLTLVCNTL